MILGRSRATRVGNRRSEACFHLGDVVILGTDTALELGGILGAFVRSLALDIVVDG
jgi:hypothetical protein